MENIDKISNSIIEVRNVIKTYKKETYTTTDYFKNLLRPEYKTAVDGVSFEIKEGEIFGLLGPNGAGKTTLIKIMMGLIAPDAGRVLIRGLDMQKEFFKIIPELNVVFARAGCYFNITGRDNLKFYGKIYRVKNLDAKINEMVEIFELQEKIDTTTDKYSTGELMRLNIAKSLLNDPKILFLDEPTIGLDPYIALKVRDHIKNLNKERGMTIILTTHYMEEADKLSDRVAIINLGKIIEIDKPVNLKSKLKREKIYEFGVPKITEKILQELRQNLNFTCSYYEEQGELRVIVKKIEDINEIVSFLKARKVEVSSIHTEKPTLEDVFLHITGKRLRSDEVESAGSGEDRFSGAMKKMSEDDLEK